MVLPVLTKTLSTIAHGHATASRSADDLHALGHGSVVLDLGSSSRSHGLDTLSPSQAT